ncbi:MAG: class A beta-lactamase-related serine hydrolase [Kiritimatiellae bacterium]|nr:class A beta-lactamase-related serine hydrolase [Kiritimatiellia bacterium]
MRRKIIRTIFFIGGVCLLAAGCRPGAPPEQSGENIPPGRAVAWNNLEKHLARRSAPAPTGEIKSRLINYLAGASVRGRYGVYFENLNSGARFGINENEPCNQWSLLKVAVAATVLKKIERRELSLADKVKLSAADLDTATLFPELNRAGDDLTVRELLERLIRHSDNASSAALGRLFKADEFQETLLAMGARPAPPGQPANFLPPASPREYANILRDLYLAGYLSRPSSQLILALMADTCYDSQIRAGLPGKVKVANKVGFNAGCGEFHDCGIVCLPGAPYLLCIMSRNSTREEAERVMKELSRQIYEFARETAQHY